MKYLGIILFAVAAFATANGLAKGPENGARSPKLQWMKNAVIYEANLRQGTKTRDLKGMQLEIPRLKDLGVDIIWLMPPHQRKEPQGNTRIILCRERLQSCESGVWHNGRPQGICAHRPCPRHEGDS